MPNKPSTPSQFPLLLVTGFVTIAYHLIILQDSLPHLLFYYLSLIPISYGQGKNVSQHQTTKQYWETIVLLGFLTALTTLFYSLTTTKQSALGLIYYLLLPFWGTWLGNSPLLSNKN